MHECRWCGRSVNLNRHHVIPQAANPALRDVRDNLIVLCRDCHFVLGHRCDWHRYNPDVMYMCATFTNVVYSADTRFGITNVNEVTRPVTNVYETPRVPLSVTNDVPASQREALRRILES